MKGAERERYEVSSSNFLRSPSVGRCTAIGPPSLFRTGSAPHLSLRSLIHHLIVTFLSCVSYSYCLMMTQLYITIWSCEALSRLETCHRVTAQVRIRLLGVAVRRLAEIRGYPDHKYAATYGRNNECACEYRYDLRPCPDQP